MSAVCWRCIKDEYLKKMVRDDGTLGDCSLCKRTGENTFGPNELAEVVAPVFKSFFVHGMPTVNLDDEPYEYGESLSASLQEVIGQGLDFEDEVIHALEANENVGLQIGQERFFDSSRKYLRLRTAPYGYAPAWNQINHQLKHTRRFFNTSAQKLFTDLLEGVENRTCSSSTNSDRKVVRTFPKGSELYRARICKSEEEMQSALSAPFKNVGPPPLFAASAGRMNPEGIPVFYGALDWETCLAETRPAIGNDTAVIKLATTKALRLLDFIRLSHSYSKPSYFHPDFLSLLEKSVFIAGLQRLISQPIVPGREQDYIITQTLAEYLAHVHKAPFDGLLLNSVQHEKGTNIVLFPDAVGNFPVCYVEDSIKLYSTFSIEYEHEERLVLNNGGGQFFIFPAGEETEV